MNDSQLLRQFEESGSDDAFSQIVERHVHGVYSTARRILQNEHLAQEVAQDAFCLLARKARVLPPSTLLVAWLHRTTWHLAMKALRGELRRHAREQLATTIAMNTPDQESLWSQIAPLLDEAIESLNEAERRAVLLRFFERKTAREIGAALGVNEEAARMRISRAVEKLRNFFAGRGVKCGSSSLIALLVQQAVEAAPPMALQAIQAAARLAAQSAIPPSLALQLLTFMAQIKLKTAVITAAALFLALLVGRQLQRATTPASETDAKVASSGTQATNRNRASSAPRLARFFSRSSSPSDPTEVAETAALERLREILYSPERDAGMPPNGVSQAIKDCGSKRREALDIILEALKSGDQKAQHRAAASLQFFKECADELIPEVLAIFKTSKDPALIAYAAMASYLKPGAEMIPMIIDAFKNNPAASDGLHGWLGSYLYHHKGDDAVVVQHLAPLLDSEKSHERWSAAWILSKTSAKNDPRIVATLVPILEAASFRNEGRSFDALAALKGIGPSARLAADAIRAYGVRVPQMHERVLDALAAIAPDLREEIPELDAKLKAREQAAALEDRAEKNQVSIASLIDGLQNPEARLRAVERLGGFGNQAAEALPRLREILKAGDSDSRPNANNFLFAVATTIRQIDPNAPTYYRPDDLRPFFMDAVEELKGKNSEASPALREAADRMFSPRPVDRQEIAAWANQLKQLDPQVGETFIRRLTRSHAFSEIETTDPELARALGQ